ncbi:Endonuclease/exonuclease/phosphatase [Penicillium canescens]|uniref:Endonuclease/exonuclease/phosphatase n=1 Tax=Penicillium canescens TaxID=5083 RepID=A0AAD6IME8_PENCN|nr:Endonuclease/exonuclease/phosphatase [Penicillium canescens]KAJ6052490.1 Endonuclease/exonuclease/phosphatase [Penicillium canescens]KAJ6063010.1 Endonuclease/exonuclease/phosphatase [Penicillium canescens]
MTRFSSGSEIGKATLGPVCRNKYSNLFERDALCCDILVPSLGESGALTSLPFGHSRCFGLISGDFNPVTPKDSHPVESNGPTAWLSLRPDETGYTWGE